MADPKASAENKDVCFNFDGYKILQAIRKLEKIELETIPFIKMTTLAPYEPKIKMFIPKRRTMGKKLEKAPVDEYRNHLVLAIEKVIKIL